MPRWPLPAVSIVLLLFIVCAAEARDRGKATAANGEVLFGSQTISSLVDRDIMRVSPEIGKFDAVRFRALGNDVHVDDIKVVFADGKSESVLSNARLRRHKKTSWIPLRHAGFIKEFQIIYRPNPKRGRNTRLEVFGEYADGWLGANGEGRKYNDGWVLVGTDTAGMRGLEKVTMKVGENDGYKKLRVAVKDHDIRMRYLTVVYDDGSKDDVTERRQRVRVGKAAGPFELEKNVAIKEIRGRWWPPESTRRNRRYATVQIWGLP